MSKKKKKSKENEKPVCTEQRISWTENPSWEISLGINTKPATGVISNKFPKS